jgi:alpha-acetolactate decarboxylase
MESEKKYSILVNYAWQVVVEHQENMHHQPLHDHTQETIDGNPEFGIDV